MTPRTTQRAGERDEFDVRDVELVRQSLTNLNAFTSTSGLDAPRRWSLHGLSALDRIDEYVEQQQARIEELTTALERMTHVHCGTNRVTQAVRWARQVLGWEYDKGCAESVEAVRRQHALNQNPPNPRSEG